MTRICLLLVLIGIASSAAAATLKVEVREVYGAKGILHVDICTRDTFLKEDCSISAEAPARVGTTIVTVPNVPPGRYAVQVFHDVNGNRKVDQGFLGIPKEDVGFSNDASLGLSGPKFDAAAFDVSGDKQIALTLRHFGRRKS